MASRLIAHLRRNVIAYLALLVALGGTGAWAARGQLISGAGDLTLKRALMGPSESAVLFESDFAKLTFKCRDVNDGKLRLENRLAHKDLHPIVDSGGADPAVLPSIAAGERETIATLSSAVDRWIVTAENFRGDMISGTITAQSGILATEPFCTLVSSVAART